MFSVLAIDPQVPPIAVGRGQQLLQRGVSPDWLTYIETGRVALGLLEQGQLIQQIGVLEGPSWLDASSAVLGGAALVDAIADTPLSVRQVTARAFQARLQVLDEGARDMLADLARAHRRQTEFAISRLAKDAEARCAEWLLVHARLSDHGLMAVELQQRKRSIAAQLGIAPETFSRVMRHLRERSLISGTGRTVNLVDTHGLRAVAGV